MKPIKFPEANRNFGAPADWDEAQGPCESLPVHDDGQSLTSFWDFTLDERLAIARGGKFVMRILGTAHPVVALGVTESSGLVPDPRVELRAALIKAVVQFESYARSHRKKASTAVTEFARHEAHAKAEVNESLARELRNVWDSTQ